MEATDAVVVPGRRLGKLAPKFDQRTLRLARYVQKRKLPKIPQTHTLSKRTRAAFPHLGMMRNDTLGDCTCAALGHSFQAWSVYGGKPWRPTDDEIVQAYDRVNGGVDEGAFMLDVLNMARREGVGGNRIYAFVAIDPQDHDQVRTAHFLFGGVYFGAALPVTAQDQQVWDVSSAAGSEPGSWGGHCMNVYDTGKKELQVATWGELQRLTWAWWDRYVDEAYVILEEDFVGSDRRSPQGISLAALAEDLGAL